MVARAREDVGGWNHGCSGRDVDLSGPDAGERRDADDPDRALPARVEEGCGWRLEDRSRHGDERSGETMSVVRAAAAYDLDACAEIAGCSKARLAEASADAGCVFLVAEWAG